MRPGGKNVGDGIPLVESVRPVPYVDPTWPTAKHELTAPQATLDKVPLESGVIPNDANVVPVPVPDDSAPPEVPMMAHEEAVSQATEVRLPDGAPDSDVGVEKLTADPEMLAQITVWPLPTMRQLVGDGHATEFRSRELGMEVGEYIVQVPEALVISSTLPPVPTARHIVVEPQARAIGYPAERGLPVACDQDPPALEVYSCQGVPEDPEPASAQTVDPSTQLTGPGELGAEI
jgi:hypothetical protein